MKTPRIEKKGVTQTSSSNARSSSIEALRPNEGNPGKRDESKQAARCSDADVTSLSPAVSRERIAERAKAIWEQRGRVAGKDQADWYEAEAQLRAES
jgi:hypothetical protein